MLYADYSDPGVVRVGSDFYLTASNFNAVPGLQILHSKDLVNWSIIGAVFQEQLPLARYALPQHGNGVWAPAIRYHNQEFYTYYPDPDLGIFVTKAKNPAGQPIYLRVAATAGAKCQFSYSFDGQTFQPLGTEFQAREGKWIGAKMGLFCSRTAKFNDAGSADIDWFRVE